ncbi:MAG TPA: beta-ketoacyl synthase chain length factor [Stellaceae bacterium]
MRVYVEGIGLRGPGLDSWAGSWPALSGAEPYVPAPANIPGSLLLPANERRRTVQTVKLALAVATEAVEAAGRDAATLASVFTSSGGDGETIHGILEALAAAEEPELSPTRFHNSVHNAPAGYWSIATRSQAPSTSLCCHDASFAAGLIDAAAQATVDDRAVALVAYDLPYPEPLDSVRRVGAIFGTALVLAPQESAAALAWVDIELKPAGAATPMADALLEALRQGTPAARSLPLLAAIAASTPATLSLDYAPGLRLELSVGGPSRASRPAPDGGAATERDDIARLIPHAGAMCLLDRVLDWDAASIRCVTRRHRDEDNPLRSHGRLGVLSGVEFAAQAMALHGRLTAGNAPAPRHGLLVSLRQVVCRCDRLDGIDGEIVVEAERLAGGGSDALYRFALRAGDVELLSGRAAVMLNAGAQ